jgi:threonine dehydrogenase-like Zn-dependent dehydrogenase
VIEAAGTPAAVEAAAAAARRGGRVLLLGLPPASSTITLPGDLLVNNDLALVASFGATRAAWTRVVALLNAKRVPLGRLVTHRYRLEDYEEAFAALAAAAGDQRGKVMFEVDGG